MNGGSGCDVFWEIDPLPIVPPRLTMSYDHWKTTEPEPWPSERAKLHIEPCSQCGSTEAFGRVWDCQPNEQPKVFCARCWPDHVAWLKAQKVTA